MYMSIGSGFGGAEQSVVSLGLATLSPQAKQQLWMPGIFRLLELL